MDGPVAKKPARAPKERRKPKKTLNACRRCRARKIKCSGHDPCHNCESKKLRCNFEEREKRIIISEEYVIGLQNRVKELESQALHSSSQGLSTLDTAVSNMREKAPPFQYFQDEEDTETSPCDVIKTPTPGKLIPQMESGIGTPSGVQNTHQPLINPLMTSKSQLLFGDHGYFRYLGHSSTWSFSRQLRNVLKNCGARCSPLNMIIPKGDGVYYDVSWRQNSVDLFQVELPSLNLAEYYANTVTFYLASLYHCFDHESFMENLRNFYLERENGTMQRPGLWHVLMLLVFACGKSILAREATPSGQTGMNFFAPAIEGLPDLRALQSEPVLAIEILCLVSLFLEASDIRSGAWGYIGQAVRISLQQGMNREFEAGILSPEDCRHRTRLFWTVYMIDKKLTYLMGVPILLHDSDITIPKPSLGDESVSASAFALHIHLSAELGHVLHVIYGLQGRLGSKFIAGVQSILQNLADLSTELNTKFSIDSLHSSGTVTRTAASLHLLYHQCVILAIRPVLLCLLENKLQSSTTSPLSDAVLALLKVCIESAVQVLKIVQALKNQTLVDLFLPYDLDAMFSSAFAIVLIDCIIPAADEQWGIQEAFSVFDHMLSRGMAPAIVYQEHLIEMNNFRMKLRGREWPTYPYNTAQTCWKSEPQSDEQVLPGAMSSTAQEPPVIQMEQELIWSWMSMENDDLGALHPDTMQSAIMGLNYDSLAPSLEFDIDNQWLWGNYNPDQNLG